MTALEAQARALFLAALERPPDRWPEFLDTACGGDADLRARVEQLLHAHREMGSIRVGGGGRPAAATAAEPAVPEAPGAVIGPYTLLEVIGEGGFGVVFRAEQGQPVRRTVALKVIKPGMDTRQVVARFEAERQALAIMDHPNIAKVLDGGATPSGRPYFVMELVKGVPITDFCDRNRLTPRQRLELFIPVCQAVQHAHTKGVIHRDLKPSNVLVALYDDRPVPKVIDFGVAKATGQRLTERTLHTGLGAVVGTVEYMSPEQAGFDQLDVDTRSDVYALGVLLYELLTGGPPFGRRELERAGVLEMLRLIREQEPPRPSARLSTAEALPSLAANRGTEPRRLTALVRGELDWIAMKALEKERARRYETANGLARDLQRYLADEPVEAGPPGLGYRLRKFARRYKMLLATAAAFLALLAGAAAVSTWLAVWALAAERDARAAQVEEGKARLAADAQAAAVRGQICLYAVANGLRLASDRDPFAAMLWFAEPLLQDPDNREQEDVTRRRLAAYWRFTPSPVLTQVWFSEHSPGQHAAFSPDGRWGCTALGTTATLWDPATGQPVGPPLRHPVSLQRVAFSRDSHRLLTVGQDEKSEAGEIRAWDVPTAQPVGTPIKHRLPFRQGIFSPDGRWVLTASEEVLRKNREVQRGEAQVWDLATGQPIGSPMTHADTVTAAAFSPDGRWVLTASRDNTARVWEAPTGKPVSPPLAHDKNPGRSLNAVGHASFSPDGRWVLTAGDDQTARLWDAATGRLLHTLKHQNGVSHASFSPDGRHVRTIVPLTDPSEIHIWDAATGQPVGPVVRCQDKLRAPRFSPDGRWLAVATDRTVQLWDAATGQPVGPALHHSFWVRDLALSPDGSRLLTVGGEGHPVTGPGPGEVRLWTVARGDLASLSFRTQGPTFAEALSPDGRWVITRNGTPTVQVLDVATGRPVGPPLQHAEPVVFARFSPDGRWVGTVSGRTAQVWEPTRGQRLCMTPPQSTPLGFLAFSADSRRFVTHTAWPRVPTTPVLGASAVGLIGSPLGQGPLLAASVLFPRRIPLNQPFTYTNDKPAEVGVWETATGRPAGPALKVGSDISSVALSPDGSRLATAAYTRNPEKGFEGGPPQVWDVARGKELYQLKLSNSGLGLAWHVTFSPDGKWVLASLTTGLGEVGLWEAATGKQIHTLSHRDSSGFRIVGLDHAAFSPDGRWVVTACGDRIARVWDVATGRPVSLMQHQDHVHHVAFSPDSRRVVTISSSNYPNANAVQVWEAATGQPISPPLPHPDGIRYASFSLDGRWVLTPSWRTVRLWDLSPDIRPTADLIRRAQLFRARRIDPAGGYEAFTFAEIQDAWQALRTRYPQDFAVTPDQVLDWHRREAEACVREKNAPAAVFHYLHGSREWLLRSAGTFP
jgi:WD40 repeat protein/serine/threonine protein kinase